MIAALGALAGLSGDASLPKHALASGSHLVQGGDVGAWDDVLAY